MAEGNEDKVIPDVKAIKNVVESKCFLFYIQWDNIESKMYYKQDFLVHDRDSKTIHGRKNVTKIDFWVHDRDNFLEKSHEKLFEPSSWPR